MTAPAHKLVRTLCAFLLAATLVPAAAFADDGTATEGAAGLPAEAAATSTESPAEGPAPANEAAPQAAVAEDDSPFELGTIDEDDLQSLETTVDEPASLLARFMSFFSAREASPVKLAPGNHAKWIDRIDDTDMPWVQAFYDGLIEASDNDGQGDYLIDDKYLTNTPFDGMSRVTASSQVGDACFIPKKGTSAAGEGDGTVKEVVFPSILAAKVPSDDPHSDEDIQAYITETYGAFDRDNPQCFWRNRHFAVTDAVYDDGTYRYYGFILRAATRMAGSDTTSIWTPRAAEYGTETSIKDAIGQYDNAIASITGSMTPADNASDYYKVKFLNDWLVDNNRYNSNSLSQLEGANKMCAWSALSALTKGQGEKAPVCEGYARALQALCIEVGVPCTLADGRTAMASPDGTGQQNGEPHMWNNVQVEGQWYGADPTWGKSYLLVGSNTLDRTRTMSNKFMTNGLSFINGPALSTTDYSYSEDKQDPRVTTPSGLTASYGDTLGNVKFGPLPAGDTPGTWSWSDPSRSVGEPGTRTFAAVFTPNDTSAYRVINRDLTVTVSPKRTTANVNLTGGSTTYTGHPIEPDVKVIVDGAVLPPSAYTVSFRDNVNAGTATVEVAPTGSGGYSFEPVTATFVIGKAPDRVTFGGSLTGNPTIGINDGPVALSASCESGITDIDFSIESGDAATIITSAGAPSLKAQKLGSVVVRATSAGDANHEGSSTTCTVTVKAPEFSAPEGTTAMPSVDPDYRIAAKGGLAERSLDKLTTASSLFEEGADNKAKQAKVATELVDATRAIMPDVRADQTAVYDVTLFRLKEDAATGEWKWSEMEYASDFPKEGIEVNLGFPTDGLSADTHTFAAAHMFTTTMSGFEPGQVETPEVRVDEYGVHFTVHGFSPMSVSWQEGKAGTGNLQQAGLSNSPGGASGNLAKTGDNLPIVALVIVVVVAAAGAAGVAIYRRRKAQAEPQDPSQDS